MKRAAVFFDLDDTLLDFHWAERRALSAALGEAGIEPSEELLRRYSEINKAQWELLEDGVLTREQVLLRRFELLFRERHVSASARSVGERYEELLALGHRFIPGAEELLRSLSRDYDLYLASNGSAAVQASRIASSGIAPFFTDLFISEELGADKPSEEYFRRCFARIPGFDPSRALMVGDSLTSDIRGGARAGILTCWFNPEGRMPTGDLRPDYEIHALGELPTLLEELF